MISTYSYVLYLLLFILCLWFWPGKSSFPRLLAALVVGMLTLPVYLLWSYSIQAYCRLRIYLLERQLQHLERQMQELGMEEDCTILDS